jgi:hypothetical protein
MSILEPSHVKWSIRLSQYDAKWGTPRSNARDREATIAHEEDHWHSWLPYESFLMDLNALDGKRMRDCKKWLNTFGDQARELERLIRIKSELFDTAPWNQGGMNEN